MGKEIKIKGGRRGKISLDGPVPDDVVIPEIDPPETEIGRYTNQLKFIRYNVLDSICKMPEAVGFKRPVEPFKMLIPNYYDFIKRPMDLGTIRKRITNKYYWSSEECLEDFQQMFTNAYVYNGPTSDVTQKTRLVELTLLRKLMEMPEEEEEIEILSSNQKDPVLQDITTTTPSPSTHVLRPREARKSTDSTESVLSPTSETFIQDFSCGSPDSTRDTSSDSSSSDSDSENDESGHPETASNSNVISVEVVKEWRNSQLSLLNSQMELIQKQMVFLSSLNINGFAPAPQPTPKKTRMKRTRSSGASKSSNPVSQTAQVRCPRPPTPTEPQTKKPKVDTSETTNDCNNVPVKEKTATEPLKLKVVKKTRGSASTASASQKVTNQASRKPKIDTSKPMGQEQIQQLQSDIYELASEDMEEVLENIEYYTTDVDEDGNLPLAILPVHYQWELRKLVTDKMKQSVRFLKSPSPPSMPTLTPADADQSRPVPYNGPSSPVESLTLSLSPSPSASPTASPPRASELSSNGLKDMDAANHQVDEVDSEEEEYDLTLDLY